MTVRREGQEPIMFNGKETTYRLSDFWGWGFSDLMNNTLRGVYCEFIVAAAMGIDLSMCRIDWTPWDLSVPHQWYDGDSFKDEIHIEVKSCAYLQSWKQCKPSSILFSIRPTHVWNEKTGYEDEAKRQSDVYIFGLYTVIDKSKVNPLILDGWSFYVIPTSVLNDQCGKQKTITLRSLEKLHPIITDYAGLKDAVFQLCAIEV